MPNRKPEPFWNNRDLMDLLRRQRDLFRRTVKSEPYPSEEDESYPDGSTAQKRRLDAKRITSVPASTLPAPKVSTSRMIQVPRSTL